MKSKVSGTSGKRLDNVTTRDEIDVDSCKKNVSLQTGEEFSPQFLQNRTHRKKIHAGEESSRDYRQDHITPGRTIQAGKDFQRDHDIPRKIAQTFEECVLEHLRDHATSKRIPTGNVTDQCQQKKVGFQFNQNERLEYGDHTGSRVSKKDPINGTKFSDFWDGRGFQIEVEQNPYFDATSRYHHRKDYTPRAYHQPPQQPSTYTNEIYNVQAGFYPTSSLHQELDPPHAYQPYGHVSGVPRGSFSEKMKFLCSFGGRILTRSSDGKLRYVGGETRIISIRKTLNYQELMKKTSAIWNQPHTIKYQLPGEDLDALISVCSDEDFHHMIDEYHELEKDSQRLRIFLESSNERESPCSFDAKPVQQNDNDFKYVVSVNGITEPSLQKSFSGESPIDSSTSFQKGSPSSIHPLDIRGSLLNLTMKPPNSTKFIQTPSNMKMSCTQSPSVHMPVQYRDPTNSQMRMGRDRMDQPAYENPYKLDVTGYHVSHTVDGIPLGTCQQLDRHVESHQIRDDHSRDADFLCLYGQADVDFKKPVLNGSAIPHDRTGSFYEPNIFFGSSHKQNPNMVSDVQWRQDMVPSSIPSKLEESSSFVPQEKTRISECENHSVILTSDLTKQYAEWDQDMTRWMERNNLNLTSDLKDIEEYQNIVSPATPLEKQHSIATTVSSDTVSNIYSGLQHNTSLETSRVDADAENPFLITTSTDSDRILTSDFNESGHLIHDLAIPNSIILVPTSSDISLVESSEDDLGDTSPSQTSDDQNPEDMLKFRLIAEDASYRLRLDSPSFKRELLCIQENERAAQYDSKDGEDDEGVKDGLITDATMAEIQAGIHGLQTIKNADLEELRELGCGTFGTVYHGKWRGTDVAIKRIKESCFTGKPSEQELLTKDFWRETQILSQLHHPNVVALYGVVRDGPGRTLSTVTEFMPNGSLRHVLSKKKKALDRRKKLIIAQDAAIGMEYLHLKNIVHFDLKCENLLVNLGDPQRPVCKVGDFGLSRIKRNSLVSGGARGTLPWIAPELLDGSSSRVSEKVDVFSFGIAMWEILTAEEPYADMHCGAIIGGIVTNTLRPPIPRRCDHGWKTLMEECWSHDPDDRPSFTEITNKLQAMSAALDSKRQKRAKRQHDHNHDRLQL